MSNLKINLQIDQIGEAVSLLKKIYRLLQRQGSHLVLKFNPNLGEDMQITDIQSVQASISEVDVVGNPVVLDPSTVTWAVADPSILDLTTNPDGTATIKAKGPLGSSQVSVNAGNLSAQETINVVPSAATALSIKFSEPA